MSSRIYVQGNVQATLRRVVRPTSLKEFYSNPWKICFQQSGQFLEKNKFSILSYLIHAIEHSLHWEAKNDEATQAFYKTASVLSCSQEPTTHPFQRSGESGQYLLTQFAAELFWCYSPTHAKVYDLVPTI